MQSYKTKISVLLTIISISSIAVADIYVDNQKGSDSNPGKTPDKAVKTLAAGIKLIRKTSDKKLVIANTGTPYYESLRLMNISGTPAKPIVIEGNQSVLSGLKKLPSDKWESRKNGIWYYPQKRYGALCPFLVINGKRVPGMPFDKLKDYSHFWSRKGVFFKPEKGKSIKDYKIFATTLTSGFMANNSSYITCRNLICEYFSNDGFNIHGDSQNLFFENIVGRRNGDDGFSIHEDVGVTVRNGYFHENNFGIQDVNASRSEYYGVIVSNNRRIGINLLGGIHTIIDSSVENNKWAQIQLESDYPKHLGFTKNNPHFAGTFYLKNLWVSGGPVGIKVLKEAAVTVLQSIIYNCQTGVIYNGSGSFHIYRTVVQDCTKNDISVTGNNFHFDSNRYYPGKMTLNGSIYNSKNFETWKLDTKGDSSSIIAPTKLDSNEKMHVKIPDKNGRNTSVGAVHLEKPVL